MGGGGGCGVGGGGGGGGGGRMMSKLRRSNVDAFASSGLWPDLSIRKCSTAGRFLSLAVETALTTLDTRRPSLPLQLGVHCLAGSFVMETQRPPLGLFPDQWNLM